MERWTFSKLEALLWIVTPLLWLIIPSIVVYFLLNHFLPGTFTNIVGIILLIINTIAATISTFWTLMWVDIR